MRVSCVWGGTSEPAEELFTPHKTVIPLLFQIHPTDKNHKRNMKIRRESRVGRRGRAVLAQFTSTPTTVQTGSFCVDWTVYPKTLTIITFYYKILPCAEMKSDDSPWPSYLGPCSTLWSDAKQVTRLSSRRAPHLSKLTIKPPLVGAFGTFLIVCVWGGYITLLCKIRHWVFLAFL